MTELSASSRARAWVVIVLTVVTVAAVALDVGSPVQPMIVALFLLSAPGTALLLGVRSWPAAVHVTAAVSASIAVGVLLSSGLLYAGWWSPAAVLGCLGLLCLGCAAARLRRSPGTASLPDRSAPS